MTSSHPMALTCQWCSRLARPLDRRSAPRLALLVMAVELLTRAVRWLGSFKLPIWAVADGAYAKADFLKPAIAMGVVVVGRLRKDAALWTVPGPRPAGSPADLRRADNRPGQACRPAAGLGHRGADPVWPGSPFLLARLRGSSSCPPPQCTGADPRSSCSAGRAGWRWRPATPRLRRRSRGSKPAPVRCRSRRRTRAWCGRRGRDSPHARR